MAGIPCEFDEMGLDSSDGISMGCWSEGVRRRVTDFLPTPEGEREVKVVSIVRTRTLQVTEYGQLSGCAPVLAWLIERTGVDGAFATLNFAYNVLETYETYVICTEDIPWEWRVAGCSRSRMS